MLGPLLGACWRPLGAPFWLKSRLKTCQEHPRLLLEYFFSAPEPFSGPFGRASGPFSGLRSRDLPIINPRRPPRGPQMPPQGAQHRPERGLKRAKTNGSEEPRTVTNEKAKQQTNHLCLYVRLSSEMQFGSGAILAASYCRPLWVGDGVHAAWRLQFW